MFFNRGTKQGLDLVLPLFTGIATGLLSLGKTWTPPLTEIRFYFIFYFCLFFACFELQQRVGGQCDAVSRMRHRPEHNAPQNRGHVQSSKEKEI
jgi:hypothetical protein